MPRYFYTRNGLKLSLPLFFPDATRGFIKTVDFQDVENAGISGVLVNTYHLYKELGLELIRHFGGIREFVGWKGAVISDSGGFQVESVVKKQGQGSVEDYGIKFKLRDGKSFIFTPERSIQIQMDLNTDLVVVLDDFTPSNASYSEAEESVARTISWAKRSKDEFLRLCKKRKLRDKDRPYIIGVVQGGKYLDLRRKCLEALLEIGFDGLGYGGWPINEEGVFDYEVARLISRDLPKGYFLYGLGVGKPDDIVECFKLGYTIFDCVLPTRDARHRRLYVFNAPSMDKIDLNDNRFYSYYVPDREKYLKDKGKVSSACDCLLCKNYSRGYLAYLFQLKESSALRLSTIHNLRFYSILMEKLRSL